MEWLALLMFICVCVVLLAGYPVAFSLAGTALIFAGIGVAIGELNPLILKSAFSRLFGIMQNPTLIAVPLFVFMGVMLEKAKIAEKLLTRHGGIIFGNPGRTRHFCCVGGRITRGQYRYCRRNGGYHGTAFFTDNA